MNEQIKKLLEQSGLQPYYDAQEGQIEKFAELLVRKCVNICNTTTDRGYLNGVVAGHKIKEYFGVDCYSKEELDAAKEQAEDLAKHFGVE